MAQDSAQLMQVLDQYQSWLHQVGNEAHDDEFEYVRQIVASPIFHQFLRGEISQGRDAEIAQASQEVLSAELSTEAIVNELTSSEIQKRRLARRKSLKALRNAVMSQPLPAAKKHHPPPFDTSSQTHSSSARPSEATSSSTTSPLKHAHTKSHSGPEGVRKAVQEPRQRVAYATDRYSHEEAAVSPPLTNGTDIDTPLEGLGSSSTTCSPKSPDHDSASFGPRVRNLSNSTNTLIERLSPPPDSSVKGHSILNGRLSSELQPNVGLNRPEMDKDLFSAPLHVLSPNLVAEWDGKEHYCNEGGGPVDLPIPPPPPSHVTHHLHYSPSPTSHVAHRPFLTTSPQHRLALNTESQRHPPPAPPPYNHLHISSTHRRTRSFEDILNSPVFDPLNFHRTPIPPSLMAPQDETHVGSGNRVVHFHIMLEKGREGLGFLVNNREGGEGGLVVQCLSPGGIAERDGHLKPNDIITAINGVSLDKTTHSEAVRLLQSVRGMVQLTCVREQELTPPTSPSTHAHPPPSPLTLTSHPPPPSPAAHSHSPPSPVTLLSHHHTNHSTHTQPPPSPLALTSHPPPSQTLTTSQAPPTLSFPTNSLDIATVYSTDNRQPRKQQIRTIYLPKDPNGVGIAVVAHSGGGTVVASILEHGAAKKDGCLSEGDRLLQVNEESVIHMRCEDVAAKLRSLEEAGQAIRLVVAHSEREGEGVEEEVVPEVMDSSGDEMEEFEVELYKQQGRGLGITIAGLVNKESEVELKGLYITSINTLGAVGKDGRAKVNDRILRVDGHSLRGLENMEAAAVLRNSGNPVRLVFGRPKQTGKGDGERDKDDHDGLRDEEQHLHSSSNPEGGNQTERPLAEDEVTPGRIEAAEEDAELAKKWTAVMGPSYEIKIARVVKSGAEGGLGICMESTAQLDDMGVPQEGSARHIITLVKDGPVRDHGLLLAGDEILQVNNTEVLGLEHDQAIEVVKETPASVMIVVCRQTHSVKGEGMRVGEERGGEGGRETAEEQQESHFTESETTSLTAESDDEKHHVNSTSDVLLAPPTNESGGFGGKDISRRFERQSWRERHAEERRRLKHRFEQRREEYERHIRELEDELLQRETEQREMQLLMAEEEEVRREEEGGRERRRSTLLHPSASPAKFDYSPYHDSNTFTFTEFTDREVGSLDTDSSLGVLSPVPGTGFWEPDLAQVALLKGEEGLGFSILDFADPHKEGERIILIQSLVEGGVAEQDGRLRVGDRLVSVNGISVTNTSLQFAVQQLVAVPHGSMVELGIHHPVLAESDFSSDSSSSSPLPTSPRDLDHDPQTFQTRDMELPHGMQMQGDSRAANTDNFSGRGRRKSSSLSGLDQLEHSVVAEEEERESCSSEEEEGGEREGEGEEREEEEGGEREGEGEEREEEEGGGGGGGGEGDGEGGGEWKVKKKPGDVGESEREGGKAKPKKKLFESEDDEPPPPYSRTDPQEKKSKRGPGENVPPAEPPRPQSSGASVKVDQGDSVEARKSDHRENISPVQLSRISSPPRGLSLSELTRVTPEDQKRWRQSRESLEREKSLESLTEIHSRSSLPRDRFGGSLEMHVSHHVRDVSSAGLSVQQTADELSPPLDSSSQQRSSASEVDQSQVESYSDTTLVGSQSDTGVGSLPDGSEDRGEPKRKSKHPQLWLQPVGNRKKTRRSPKRSESPKHRVSDGTACSDRGSEGAKTSSLAVVYTHSQVTNTSSQDSIQDGLSPDMSDYDHSSELDNDPREIHIAKTSNFGLALTQDSKTNNILVKSVKGAIRKDGRIRTGDQILAINRERLENVSLAKASKMLKKAASKSEGVTISYLPAPHIHGFSSNSYAAKSSEKPPVTPNQQSQHFPNQPLPPGIQGGPPLHNVPKQDSFAGGQTQNVGMAPSHPTILPPQMVAQGPPAMSQWTSYPLGPGATISPMQPPPYNYQLSQPARQTFGQPLQPVVWQVQQPGSLQLPVGQPAPQQVTWILREPPHYTDHLVQQQHMMSGAQFSLPQTGPVSVPPLPSSQLPPPLPSQLPPSLPSQPPPSLPSQPPHSLPSQPQPQQPPSQVPHTQPTANAPRMTKAQSEIKLRSGVVAKPEHERRHKSQSGASPKHPPHPYTVYRRRQQQQAQAAAAAAAAAARQQMLVEEPSEPRSPPQPRNRSHNRSHDYSQQLHNMSRDLTHDNEGAQQQLRNSMDREVDEDPALRKEFPNIEGILFEVWLSKGSGGLGMSIVANRDDHAPGPRGIVIMGIQAGGVADRSKMIMWGDMILKINDTCVIGMTQQEVQEMLMKASSSVRFVMLRQSGGKALERAHSSVDRDITRGLPQVRVVQLQRDNEKGLGFNVAEGGQGGVVTVSSITPGGPAEKEGTLQPGDQLISIDGQKILGHSFEKARHLLQQARARGWVQLIVTCRGGAAVGGEGTGSGNLKNKGTVPESVVLRQKKRSKENSLKSSRRRPVSVDYEAGVVRTPSVPQTRDRRTGGDGERGERGGAGGGGGGGGRSEGGEASGKGVSNRNSHTLSEREVEIGFQKMEKHNVIVPGRESRITIFKGSQVLGLTVIGGVDTYLHNIIIERIIPGSSAATDGRLRPGDRIMEVNDVSLSEATCEDALAALQHPSPFIHLTLRRDHNPEPLPKEPPASPTASVEKVELVKPPHGGLGLLIQESPDQAGVFIQEVVENQAAFLDGRIKSGDKILAINHNSTVGASQDTVFKLLQGCQGKVVLTVQHRDAFSPAPSSIEFSETDSNFPQPPAVKYPFREAQVQIPNRDPPPYPSPFSSYLPDPQKGVHSAMWGPMQERVTQHSPPPPPVHCSREGKVKYVQLRKGPSGLGFTIVGGAGSSHGDKPIYVNRVLEEGVAGRDRRLHKGDQLLAVNGISFEGITHQFAAETLKQQSRHGDVELTVLSFE